jgi:hypothetical protein
MTNQPLLQESPCNARNTDQPVLPESHKLFGYDADEFMAKQYKTPEVWQ